MDGIEEVGQHIGKEQSLRTTLVSNGRVDFRGRIADKRTTGGWKAYSFIIASDVADTAFLATTMNMVSYLVFEMHQSIPKAAAHMTDWIGAAYVLTILGAFLADAYLGRFRTIVIFSSIHAVGMVLLTLSASIDSLHPSPCTKQPCKLASSGQTAFLTCALALIALGAGGIKSCTIFFKNDQFDEADENEVHKRRTFFNLVYPPFTIGAFFSFTLLAYIQEEKSWSWGFGVPTAIMFCLIIIFVAGMRHYRYQNPMGSAFTRFLQVVVASVRNHTRGVEVGREDDLYEVSTKESDIFGSGKLPHTAQYSFLDKAAVITDAEAITKNRWRLCTVTQVEEFKYFLRVLPVYASTIALPISCVQISTFFISQALIMDRKLGPDFVIPAGSIPVFTTLTTFILLVLYEELIVPTLRRHTGHRKGITSLQRMGVGLFISIFALASAALVEKKRRDHSKPSTMSVFWLLPQIFLMASAEILTYVGQFHFFYDEATDGTRSLNSSMLLSEVGIGCWLSTAIVKIIEGTTGGEEKGWLRNDINKSRLDYFYWILAGVNGVNFLIYLWIAGRYKGKGSGNGRVRDEAVHG